MTAGYWDTTITYKQLAKTLVILFTFYIALTTTTDYHKTLDKATDSEDFAYTIYLPHTQHPPSAINIPAQIDMGFKRDAYTKAITAIINCRPHDIKRLERIPSECTGTDSTVSRGCSPKEIAPPSPAMTGIPSTHLQKLAVRYAMLVMFPWPA